ncbi:MAG TPA: hypothetical protein PKB00_05580 [Microthrixaceae bacterium]|nr:hypothetical protein [Microthrixaceae bacterium]
MNVYASFAGEDPFGIGSALGGAFGAGFGGGGGIGGGLGAGAGSLSPLTAPGRNELLGIGAVSAAAGAVLGTIGAFSAARNSKTQAKSAAMAADFQASMAARNARMAEMDAQSERDAGRKQLQMLGMQYEQAAGAQRVAQAASGTTGTSYDEARAAMRLAKRLDALTIRQNTARGVTGRLTQATNARNAASMGRVSAANLRATAGSINPGIPTFAALLEGAARSAGPAYAYSRS